jgi:hypothetical protein
LSEVSGSWNIADAPTADPPQCLRRQVVDAFPVQVHGSAGDAARRRQQSNDRRAGQRFSGARFADDAENFAGSDVEGSLVDRTKRPAPRRKFNAELVDLQQSLSLIHPLPGQR